jgi:predicted  nucleic acid-binding Zn-ribbon protein
MSNETKQYQPHQQRVVDEKSELDAKREKLHAFFDNPIFNGLESKEQTLLRRQYEAMAEYSNILAQRIQGF